MNPFEMVVLIIAIVTIGKVISNRRHMNRDGHGNDVIPRDPDAGRMKDEIRQLKERIAVLERLATDSTSSLDREIEKLRDKDRV
ncbi:hypothetical protein [Sphingobium boeckii]|uniref:Integrase/recombinase n=1 Tax=Sphingobium boeckii TaxID=1082345 RepID=A0A7W9EFC5_9SPHN|nr:hypothetical protein [Sphingobium boeckii]MBB5687168.1 integrase/recombinase [Sphingobium boeckii]